MKQQLEELLKKDAGYTTAKVAQCKDCKFYTTKENSHIDRMWDSLCSGMSNRHTLNVDSFGRCKYFEANKCQ